MAELFSFQSEYRNWIQIVQFLVSLLVHKAQRTRN